MQLLLSLPLLLLCLPLKAQDLYALGQTTAPLGAVF